MPTSSLAQLVQLSRPRFWLYLTGPFMLVAAWIYKTQSLSVQQIALFISWITLLTTAGNLYIYGINDWFDEATDALNAKKDVYEQRIHPSFRSTLKRGIILSSVLLIALGALTYTILPSSAPWVISGLLAFFFFGGQYSAPPLRTKAVPIVDSFFNVLYLAPVLIAWGIGASHLAFPWQWLAAGWLWCMAMHAVSAVPDIEADTRAGLQTVATLLGARGTILFCGMLYLLSAVLSYPALGPISVGGGVIYLGLMSLAWNRSHSRERLFRLYTLFPFVNTLLGFILWAYITFIY